MTDRLFLEDGTSLLLLEDGTSILLLENSTAATYGTVGAATATTGAAVRTEEYFLELLDADMQTIGQLHPVLGATITCRSGQPIGRTVGNLVIPEDEFNDLNPDTDRIRPWVVTDGDPHSLAVLTVTSDTEHDTDLGHLRECQLHDLGSLLTGRAGNLDNAYGVRAGTPVRVAIENLLEQFGIVNHQVVDTGIVAGNHLAWPATTRPYDVLVALAKITGLTPPWFDVDGVAHVTFLPYVGQPPAFAFERGTASTIGTPGVQRKTDRWAMPTKWRVFSKTTSGLYVAGTYTLPDDHEFSRFSRGLPRDQERAVELPGLATDGECAARARDLAQREARVFLTETFTAPKVPTLELNDIVTVDGVDRLLTAWTFPMEATSDSDYTVRDSLTKEVE